MPPPAFVYLHARAAEREQPRLFTDTLIKSGRFYRDFASNLHFKVADNDYVRVANKRMFRELLQTGEYVHLTGDSDDAAFDTLWSWMISRLWTIPRFDPDRAAAKPLPVRYVGQVRR